MTRAICHRGKCDVCLSSKDSEIDEKLFDEIKAEILIEISENGKEVRSLDVMSSYAENQVLYVVRKLGDSGDILIAEDNTISIPADL